MKITTNNHWRNFLYGYELTPKERKEFDWMTDDEIDSASFVRYRDMILSLDEFMRIDPPVAPHAQRIGWETWQGYSADTAFSATLIRVSDDGEQYQIGRAYSCSSLEHTQ